MTWIKEFGTEFDVPSIVSERLIDVSWHNDVSPSFVRPGDEDNEDAIRLWVEHPDPNRREYIGSSVRFIVGGAQDGGIYYEGEDVNAAIDSLLSLAPNEALCLCGKRLHESTTALCIDCGCPTCPDCRVEDAAGRCLTCAAEFDACESEDEEQERQLRLRRAAYAKEAR